MRDAFLMEGRWVFFRRRPVARGLQQEALARRLLVSNARSEQSLLHASWRRPPTSVEERR